MASHRTLHDAKGRDLRLRQLNWEETKADVIEGDPAEIRREFRERRSRSIRENPGYATVLFECENESALPRYHGVARLERDGTPSKVFWFQNPSNPLACLGDLLSDVDWKSTAKGWYP